MEQFTEMLQGKTSFAVLAGALPHLCSAALLRKSLRLPRCHRRRRCQTAAAAAPAAAARTAHPRSLRAQTRQPAPLMTLSMEAEGIALPESAWAQEGLIPCLAEIATSAAHAGGRARSRPGGERAAAGSRS